MIDQIDQQIAYFNARRMDLPDDFFDKRAQSPDLVDLGNPRSSSDQAAFAKRRRAKEALMHLLLWLALVFPFDSLGLAQVGQAGTDALLGRLAGQWSGTGTVLNQPAKIQMEWKWELGGRFIKLTFRNEMGAAPTINLFEGHAYYRAVGEGRYRGMWFDSSGMFRPLDAKRDGDALVSKWGTPDTEEGETTYRLRPDGSMDVIDRVKGKDGTWRTFGQSGLMKR